MLIAAMIRNFTVAKEAQVAVYHQGINLDIWVGTDTDLFDVDIPVTEGDEFSVHNSNGHFLTTREHFA